MVKNGYYGNEGLRLAWDCIEVFQDSLFITTVVLLSSSYNEVEHSNKCSAKNFKLMDVLHILQNALVSVCCNVESFTCIRSDCKGVIQMVPELTFPGSYGTEQPSGPGSNFSRRRMWFPPVLHCHNIIAPPCDARGGYSEQNFLI